MNRKVYTINLIAVLLLSSFMLSGQGIPMRDTLSMGPSYANDIFYSLKNGEVSSVPRANWDIAFYTEKFSAGIIINNSFSDPMNPGDPPITLYTYPKGDTNSWSSIDTNGMAGWTNLYNSATVWEEGAFNANGFGQLDYGWGIYNMVDHNLYGDSIYVIFIPETGYKKLWIQKKHSIDNIYFFKYANLDGTDEYKVELDIKPYETKRFAYYSITNNEPLDREPETGSWDILFTRYMDMVPTNEGGFEPYLVTGALSNVDIGANHFYPATPDFNGWPDQPFDSLKNVIGYDWKSFDMETFSWKVTDSNYYFVQNFSGDVYKIKFFYWAGQGTGDFAMDKWLISLSSIDESNPINDGFNVFPNPSQSNFTIKSNSIINDDCQLVIMDQSGRMIYQKTHSADELINGVNLSDLVLSKGLYLLYIKNKQHISTQKLIIN